MADRFAQFGHKGWIRGDAPDAGRVGDIAKFLGEIIGTAVHSTRPTVYHAAMLGLYGLPLVLLAKQMAALVLAPESIAAIRAALDNRLQRSVNVLLGSVLASIGLTIPLVILVALVTGRTLVLGLDNTDTVLLLLTLVTSTLTFSLPRTNLLPGCVHLLLFGAYIMLLFDR